MPLRLLSPGSRTISLTANRGGCGASIPDHRTAILVAVAALACIILASIDNARHMMRRAAGAHRIPRDYITGTNMMWAFGVPGYITHGAPPFGAAGSPVEAGVAYGMYTT